MKEVISFIKDKKIGSFKENVSIKNLTTYKIGGVAKIVVYPKDYKKLILLIKYLREEKVKYKIIGYGSNLIFSDDTYDGVLIKLDCFNELKISDTIIKVGAGVSLVKLSYKVGAKGLTGLEFASGIPGSIGGAVFMNAGAYKSDMGYIVSEIKVITPTLEVKTLYNKDLNYKYRSSFLQTNREYICIEATIVLRHGDKKEIKELMEQRRQKRFITQPLEYPSAGSVFRNPENLFAGKLIEDCNLKGYTIGGAKVSNKHANFIINYNNAKASDVRNLILYVHDKVKNEKNIDLKIEQEFVNWE